MKEQRNRRTIKLSGIGSEDQAETVTEMQFLSRAVLRGRLFTKNDDWESLLYMLVKLKFGTLPWQG